MNHSAAFTGAFVGIGLALLLAVPMALLLPNHRPAEAGFDTRSWYFAGRIYDTQTMIGLVEQSKAQNPGYSFALVCTNPDMNPHGVSGIIMDEVRGVDRERTKYELANEADHPTPTDNRVCNAMIARIKQ